MCFVPRLEASPFLLRLSALNLSLCFPFDRVFQSFSASVSVFDRFLEELAGLESLIRGRRSEKPICRALVSWVENPRSGG
ncbi:hypothetical protein J5N97_017686 [Dioscorea zingiberensis]|uniref:Uncharacterized protein n=1 Tax=Dioscorea zingiberensis TaxID=325984 RepID=A0A9D5HGG1_9LILI|nr:hypothetical protein J5N97_017686 [Dioscorea zingiberensis]